MELDQRGGNGVDNENTGPRNEYETIQSPDEGYRHTADPGAIYTLPEPSTASTGPRDTGDPGAIYTLPEPSTASTGPRDTGDPGAIYTLPEPSTASTGPRDTADPGAIYTLPGPSTASTGPRDSQPANSPSTERPRGHTVQIIALVIGMILLAGILGYYVWKVSKQNEQIIELIHEIQVIKEDCICPIYPGKYH